MGTPAFVRSSPYWPVVRHRILRRLLPGFALSYLGEGMALLAVSWLAIQLAPRANAGVWVAAAVAAYTLPGALGTVLFARALSGRSGAQLAAWDAVLRAVMLGAIPVVHLAGALDIRWFTLLLGCSALLRSWGSAGRFTLIAELLPVEHRLAGNALIGLFSEASTLIGPALAALLIAAAGPVLVIAVAAGTYAVLAVSYLIAVPRAARAPIEQRQASSLAGFAAIWRDRPLLGLSTLTFGFFFLYGPVQVALPIHVAESLGNSAGTLAAFWTAFGAGALIGGFAAGYLRRWRLWPTIIAIVVGWGAALLPLGLGAPTGVALVAIAIGGLIWAPYPAATMALLQRSTDGAGRAPVLAAYAAIATLSVPLGTITAGPLITGVGAEFTILAAAVLTVAFGVIAAAIAIWRAVKGRTVGPVSSDVSQGEQTLIKAHQ
ncbi:MFS transporter [Micromonospora maris]|uniref:MFS transporter n=1 Tax=Micromonospora TaxID=1873 RepID=UPI000206B9E4|nr:major facilitator transporter [Micromonospora maris AB-18-032]